MMEACKPVRERAIPVSRHALFIPALWLALLTAIICAILPAGLPLTKTVGSAFSPATTMVALKGGTEQIRTAIKRIIRNDPDPMPLPSVPAHMQLVPGAIVAIFASAGRRPPLRSSTRPLSGAPAMRPYPRGPPRV